MRKDFLLNWRIMDTDNMLEKINKARKKVTDSSVGFATLNVEHLINLIKSKKANNPEITTTEIIQGIEENYKKIAFYNTGKTIRDGRVEIVPVATRSDFCLLKTVEYVRKHPEVIWDVIDKSDRADLLKRKEVYRYVPNRKESIYELMQDACSVVVGKEQNADFQRRFIEGLLDVNERAAIQKNIVGKLGAFQQRIEQDVRISYTKNITEIAKVLDENGCFSKGLERHNRRLRMIGLDDMQEAEITKKGNKPTIRNMSDWKQANIVGKLPVDTLIIASAFFTNRICKEYISFKRGLFLLQELNGIEEDNYKKPINIEHLRAALAKYEFHQKESRDEYTRLALERRSTDAPTRVDKITYQLDYTIEEYSTYTEEFSKLLPESKNELIGDKRRFAAYDDVMEVLYQKKDFALDSLVMSSLDKSVNRNWGYIEEGNEKGNSIQRKKGMIALGFDIEGFNTPIRLHTSLVKLRRLVEDFTGNVSLPVYDGEDDWFVEDKFGDIADMNTQVFRPTTKFERKLLKDKTLQLKEGDRLYGFVSHLNWIANGIVPNKYKKRKTVLLDSGKVEENEIER